MTDNIDMFYGATHDCGYLPNLQARNLFPDPNVPMHNDRYSQLIAKGFRRSGEAAYRPQCPSCKGCIAVRIKVTDFIPNRRQRRCLKRNTDITISLMPAGFVAEHFELSRRYVQYRHTAAGMDDTNADIYRQFMLSDWSRSRFIEFRIDEKLIAVAVTDLVNDGASAFYTFFDPDYASRSLGTYAILQQIELMKRQRKPFLYLGYWIANSQKMKYKSDFSAIEGFDGLGWSSKNVTMPD